MVEGDARVLGLGRLVAIQGGSEADEIKVRTVRTADGKAIQAVVVLVLAVNSDVVRAVLSDYENMPQFVPDILATRLISTGPGRKRVEIDGVARLLVLEYATHTTLDVVTLPDGSVALDSVAGNLAVHGVVRVLDNGSSTRVDYEVRITPDFWVPPLIGDFLIGRQIVRQFEGMAAEMHRRGTVHQTHRQDGLGAWWPSANFGGGPVMIPSPFMADSACNGLETQLITLPGS